jgi:protein-tyrosine phosphatase
MIDKILPNVSIGRADDVAKHAHEFDAILNVASEASYQTALPYLHYKLYDGFEIPQDVIDGCMMFMAAHDTMNHRILVHCMGGWSRSAGIVICYVAMKLNLDFPAAYAYVKERRPEIDPAGKVLFSIRDYLFTHQK